MRRVRAGSLPDRTPRLGRSTHRERCQPPWIVTWGTRMSVRVPGSQSKAAGTFPGALSAPNAAGGPEETLRGPSASQPLQPSEWRPADATQ